MFKSYKVKSAENLRIFQDCADDVGCFLTSFLPVEMCSEPPMESKAAYSLNHSAGDRLE